MKKNLHPQWQECRVTCACGNSFVTRGNTATLQVDICNQCHPFFTGEERFVDKEGRLDKFKKKMSIAKKLQAERLSQQKAKQKAKEAERAKAKEALSFKQILNQSKNQLAQKKDTNPIKTSASKLNPKK